MFKSDTHSFVKNFRTLNQTIVSHGNAQIEILILIFHFEVNIKISIRIKV